MSKTKVAATCGNSRRENILKALNLLRDEIVSKLKGKRKVVIKVNFVTTRNQLSATHVEAAQAVLAFLKPIYKQKIIIAEKASVGTTEEGFKNYGYYDLAKNYNIEFFNLAKDKFLPIETYTSSLGKLKAGASQTILESDFLISVTPAKTHDVGIVTLSLKNAIMGSLENPPLIHQGFKIFNLNLATLAQKIHPHLSIIDGFEGMGGNGPLYGVPVKSKFSVASLDFLAADTVGAKIMGFDPEKIGYLYFCKKNNLGQGDLAKIEILGERLDKFKVSYPKPPTYNRQARWDLDPTFSEKVKIKMVTLLYPKIKNSPLAKVPGFESAKRVVKNFFGFS